MLKLSNKVSHTTLLHKLHMYGTDPETCGWFRSFLCSRTQRVVVDGEAFIEVEITSRVPQGSVLRPIFFLIYINDMAEYTKHSSVRLFADDTIIYTSSLLQKMTAKNSQDLQALERWEAD